MAFVLVTYDLNSPGQNYTKLYEKLKSFNHKKPMESFWVLHTSKSHQSIYDELKLLIDKNDLLFVSPFPDEYKCWIGTDFLDWLKRSKELVK